MSITDELRDCIRTASRSYEDVRNPYNDREILHIPEEELLRIADRIDERYHRDMATAQQAGINEGEDAAMREGWVKLPVDADGVPIRVGDTVEEVGEDPTRYTVCGVGTLQDRPAVLYGNPSKYGYADGWDFAESVRHVQPDSWERIIEDAGNSDKDGHEWAEYATALVERCRRLAGGE